MVYDIRYWANCYGMALNYWEIGRGYNADAIISPPLDEKLKEKIEKEFNSEDPYEL